MKNIIQWLSAHTGISPAVQEHIFSSVLIIVVLWILRLFALRLVWKNTEDAQLRYRWRKWLTYSSFFIGLLLIGRVWFEGIGSFATYLGLLSAGLAIALKDLIASFAGWMFILWRKPFSVSDRIQIGKYAGDVIDIRIFQFSLLEIGSWVDADQSTGRVMHLPNSLVLTDVVTNYIQGFPYIWDEIPVLITFESNWQKAKDLLLQIAQEYGTSLSASAEKKLKEATKRYMIFYTSLTPTVYTSVKDSGVNLTLRYLIEPRKRRQIAQDVWEHILMEFQKHDDIDLAYPTQRFYNNVVEGKKDARAKL